MAISKKKISTFLLFYAIFFTFSGYYLVLMIWNNIGLIQFSRYVTIPLKVISVIFLFGFFLFSKKQQLINYSLWFFFFCFLYMFRIFIDYLKIDAWGAEYNILCPDILPFCMDRTRFIAISCYMDKRYNTKKIFEKWREEILTPLKNRLLFKDEALREKIWYDDWEDHLPNTFMIYVKNW